MRNPLSSIRYRFLLVAGLMPYILGTAAAHYFWGRISLVLFLIGLMGVLGALLGVEGYNEFFETRSGTDLVFLENPPKASSWTFVTGSIGFSVALSTAVYLAGAVGPFILILALYGFFAAVFYVGPPVKWAYKGIGEIIIALAYGPFMTIGAYYIQTVRVDWQTLLISLIPGFLTFAVVLSNEIPQYHGDKVVGKMNLVVRLGQRRASGLHQLSLLLGYLALVMSALLGSAPIPALLSLVTLPLAIWTARISAKYYDKPIAFVRSIRGTVAIYTLVLITVSVFYFLA